MECKQLTLSNMEVVKTPKENVKKIAEIQDDMRREVMHHTSNLLPRFFQNLANMKDDDFMKMMMQVMKFSIPTIKAEEMERMPKLSRNEIFERKFHVPIK